MTVYEKRKILVAMSGGVDSSVAALLLKRAGHDLIGAFMKVWSGADGDDPCWIEDRRDAMRVAAMLDIPLVTLDFEDEYREDVVSNLFDEYAAGRTPNPDVRCNSTIKFPLLWREAGRLGCDWIATGHYARIEREGDKYAMLAGLDSEKDQSYFLHRLTQHDLSHTIFPVGEMTKPEVRRIARDAGFPNANKRSTRGICFIGKIDLPKFLHREIPNHPGSIVDTHGQILGSHDGLASFTIGQRSRISIGGGEPLYVAAKDAVTNTLIVAPTSDLIHDVYEIRIEDVHWIFNEPSFPFHCSARIRYREPQQNCVITSLVPWTRPWNRSEAGRSLCVRFDAPERGVAPGQSVVFYDDDLCLGGGIIRS